jgi:hypothetical protein
VYQARDEAHPAKKQNRATALEGECRFQKADKEYKALLEEHMVSDQIAFVAKPAK